jgi:hypothetical protein
MPRNCPRSISESFGCVIPSTFAACCWLHPRLRRVSAIFIANCAFKSISSASRKPNSSYAALCCLHFAHRTAPNACASASLSPIRIRSISRFGVSIPRFDFFSKQCRIYTAPAKSHRINGTVGIAAPILDNLHDSRRAKSLQRFCRRVHLADLRLKERKPEGLLHLLRHRQQILLRRSDPAQRPEGVWHVSIIPNWE